MSSSRIKELADSIQRNTDKFDNFFVTNGVPAPSFDASTPLDITYPGEIKACRQVIIEDTDELHSLTLGPVQTVNWMRELGSPVLQAVYRFGFALSFPVGKTATFAEIAQKTGRNEAEVRRILRAAMTYRLFREPEPGLVAHTAASKALAEKPLLRQWVGMWLEELTVGLVRVCCPMRTQAAQQTDLVRAKIADALVKWPGSQEPNQTAFNIAHNVSGTAYEDINGEPDRAKRFKDAMAYFQSAPGFEADHVAESFGWDQLGQGVVVDVGGSHGIVSIELARRFPLLQFVVQDRAEVISGCAAALPKEIEDRVSFEEHDFFNEQPVRHADVYFFRWIFHNWADSYSVKILKALIPALKSGARVLIQDIVLPLPGTMSTYLERKARATDLGMLAMANAKERDREDWVALLQAADKRFELRSITTPEKSELSLVEVIWNSTG